MAGLVTTYGFANTGSKRYGVKKPKLTQPTTVGQTARQPSLRSLLASSPSGPAGFVAGSAILPGAHAAPVGGYVPGAADDPFATVAKPGADASTPTIPAPTYKPPAAQAPLQAPTIPGVDLSSDPILAQVVALANQTVAQQQAASLAAKKQALIQFGDGSIVAKILGAGNDSTSQAATQNPFSTLANLSHADQLAQHGIDQKRKDENLFYSSTRGNDLAEENRNYLGNEAQAQNGLYALLGQQDQAVQQARLAAAQQIQQAEVDAYLRYLQAAAAAGYSGYGGGGTPTSTPDAPFGNPNLIPVRYGPAGTGADPYYAAVGIRNLFAT